MSLASSAPEYNIVRLGPGISLMPVDLLMMRLTIFGLTEQEATLAFLSDLGVGTLEMPDGYLYVHWEALLILLMDRLGANDRITVTKSGNVQRTTVPYFDKTRSNTHELVTLCILLDKALDGAPLDGPSFADRIMETRRQLHDLEASFQGRGLGKVSMPPKKSQTMKPAYVR